jgi:UDP-3-O-[3-hydroxymyristoyl] glucosamine N-acyltransferase
MATVRELAALVEGEVCGDGDREITAARPLDEATTGDIAFLDLDRNATSLTDCAASAVVVPPGVAVRGTTAIRVADPFAAFVTIANHLHGGAASVPHGIDPLADVDPTVTIGPDASVHPFAVIGPGAVIGARCRLHPGAVVGRGCRLGDDVTLHPHAVLYARTILGHRVTVHANAVVGADGFGYRLQNGRHVKVPQLGWVEVGDDVEIGACSTIDRGTFGPTRIGQGTKIDNLVMIAHNCRVGRHNILVSQMGMAGSSGTGDYVVIAGQVGVVDHVHIGDGCTIGGQAAVTKDVPPGQRMLGSPATPEREQKRILMSLAGLPDLRKAVRRIMQHLGLKEDDGTSGRRDDAMHAA